MTRSLLGSVVSVQFGFTVGTRIAASAVSAHGGSVTGLVGAAVNCSPPPNPFSEAASPVGFGMSVAVMELASLRNCRATRLTSATVTRRIASTLSSGELRPSAASACDQTAARSEIEFRRNSADATSFRFSASTSSSGKPSRTYLATTDRISATTPVGAVEAGSAATLKPTLAFG
jgi:hypothetical protein